MFELYKYILKKGNEINNTEVIKCGFNPQTYIPAHSPFLLLSEG